uniref:Unannotated protein n=1 Tax=freshwater metagenome TaxID=449393 RepID=A0A6J7P4T6_9ZZZZ
MLLIGVQMCLDEARTYRLVIVDEHHNIGVKLGERAIARHRDPRGGLQHIAEPGLTLLKPTDALRRGVGGTIVHDKQTELWVRRPTSRCEFLKYRPHCPLERWRPVPRAHGHRYRLRVGHLLPIHFCVKT